MSVTNAHINSVNFMIMHPKYGWVIDQQSNPLYGWPMKKVLQSNDYDVPINDLYGRLFFYIVDKMKDFVELIKT